MNFQESNSNLRNYLSKRNSCFSLLPIIGEIRPISFNGKRISSLSALILFGLNDDIILDINIYRREKLITGVTIGGVTGLNQIEINYLKSHRIYSIEWKYKSSHLYHQEIDTGSSKIIVVGKDNSWFDVKYKYNTVIHLSSLLQGIDIYNQYKNYNYDSSLKKSIISSYSLIIERNWSKWVKQNKNCSHFIICGSDDIAPDYSLNYNSETNNPILDEGLKVFNRYTNLNFSSQETLINRKSIDKDPIFGQRSPVITFQSKLDTLIIGISHVGVGSLLSDQIYPLINKYLSYHHEKIIFVFSSNPLPHNRFILDQNTLIKFYNYLEELSLNYQILIVSHDLSPLKADLINVEKAHKICELYSIIAERDSLINFNYDNNSYILDKYRIETDFNPYFYYLPVDLLLNKYQEIHDKSRLSDQVKIKEKEGIKKYLSSQEKKKIKHQVLPFEKPQLWFENEIDSLSSHQDMIDDVSFFTNSENDNFEITTRTTIFQRIRFSRKKDRNKDHNKKFRRRYCNFLFFCL